MEISPVDIIKLWNRPSTFKQRLLKRSEVDIGGATNKVEKIMKDIKNRGDLALLDYTKKFDNVNLGRDQIRVKEQEIERAKRELHPNKVEAIEEAAENIRRYHEKQVPESWMEEMEKGVNIGQRAKPLGTVGVYAPGGTAEYPSSVLMSGIPADVAGVENIVLCTPPNSQKSVNDAILYAAHVSGVDKIFKIGGAQAITAMAYGTRTIPNVDKIVGPGNIYVAAAKKVVSQDVSIDFEAGPSEVLILADVTANPRHAALDLVSQAEHDPSSAAILVTDSESLAEEVQNEVMHVLEEIPRERTAAKALEEFGHIIVVRDLNEAADFANEYAAEHVEIMTRNPEDIVEKVNNAGAIFVGDNSPTAAGDFAVGPSHVLPTGRKAKSFAGLSVNDFVRMPSVQRLTKEGLEEVSEAVIRLAEMEGLEAHAKSVRERLEE